MNPDAIRRTERVPHGGTADPDLVDFSANTNPRTPPGVAEAYDDALETARRYPDDDYPDYRVAAGAYVGCDPRDVVPTPGGLAGIRLACEAHVSAGDTVLVPYPSFGEYAREVRLQGATPAFVPHDEVLDADPADHALAIVCNPNNPTGTVYEPDTLTDFLDRCRAADAGLLVDEAFLGFTDRPSLAGREGVIVVRSLTKLFGLPGLRAGFVVGGTYRLETARRAWNVGTPAATVGTHCLRRTGFVEETRERVRRERARMVDRLSDRYDVTPSNAPFVLLDVGDRSVDAVVDTARDHGLAIRDARTFRGLNSHVRVAVRRPGENDRLLEALTDV